MGRHLDRRDLLQHWSGVVNELAGRRLRAARLGDQRDVGAVPRRAHRDGQSDAAAAAGNDKVWPASVIDGFLEPGPGRSITARSE